MIVKPKNSFDREAFILQFAKPNKDRVIEAAKRFRQIYNMSKSAMGRDMANDVQYFLRIERRKSDIPTSEAIRHLKWMADYVATPKVQRWKEWTETDREHAKRMRDQGASYREIGRILGRDMAQVYRLLNNKKYGNKK